MPHARSQPLAWLYAALCMYVCVLCVYSVLLMDLMDLLSAYASARGPSEGFAQALGLDSGPQPFISLT